jgi:type II secretory ATPase GspE/PulE/Tfp pilus assembly ATPase PilB-like protein
MVVHEARVGSARAPRLNATAVASYARTDHVADHAEDPVSRLVNAILLSALKQCATEIAIRTVDDRFVVDFLIDGVEQREMEPEAVLRGPVVRRISVMASVPYYRKGESGLGEIHLVIGEDREAHFAVRLEGHGDAAAAYLRILG